MAPVADTRLPGAEAGSASSLPLSTTSLPGANGGGIARANGSRPPSLPNIVSVGERARSADTLPQAGKVAWRPGLPIVIDNGTHELRAGFAASDAPSDMPALAMENVVSKYKDRKRNVNFMLAGSDCYVDAQSRAAIKSPFDGDVVTNFELMVSERQ